MSEATYKAGFFGFVILLLMALSHRVGHINTHQEAIMWAVGLSLVFRVLPVRTL